MAWRAFSVVAGLCAFVAVAAGVGGADVPLLVSVVGYFGSVVIGLVVHGVVVALPARRHTVGSVRVEAESGGGVR